ncbi:hypothetical protein [Methylosinus sp. LW4]|uniref:hypothetical protein n=1 Tax=Methylosinus sp. LW4 TaxID=136993 RepID=UPI00036B99BD|nr:hypothetical protein [Methylosinus sp. LW4]
MRFFRRHARIISAILLSELDLTLALFGALLTLLPIGRSERANRGSADPTKPGAYDFWHPLTPITRPEQFRRDQTTELIVEAPAKPSLAPKKSDVERG